MLVPLLQKRRPRGAPGWPRLVADLEHDAARTVTALRAVGHHGELPVTLLVDGETATRSRLEPGEVAARRLRGDQGQGSSLIATGEVDLDRALALWLDTAHCLMPSPWLRGLATQALGRPLPPGSPIVLVDVDAAQALARAMHPAGRGHTARFRNVLTLGWQREVLRWLLGPASPAHTLADLTLIRPVHRELLRQQRELGRLQPLLAWLSDLGTAPPVGVIPRAGHASGVPSVASRLREPDRDLPQPWAELESCLANAAIATYQIDESPPETPPSMGGLDPRAAELLDEPHGGEDVQPWRRKDYLGVFAHRAGLLLPGIHLFCERIEQTAQAERIPVERLAWMVLWHELTHWRLHLDRRHSHALVRLRAFDMDEVVCELLADRAVERGSSVLVPGLQTVPRSPLPLRRWRDRTRLLPYSWYPRMLVPIAGFSDETLRCFALGAGEALARVEASWTGRVATEDPDAQAAVESVAALLTGATPPRLAHVAIGGLVTDPQRLAPAGSVPPVYLWRTRA